MQKKNVYGLLKVTCFGVIPFFTVASLGTWYLFKRIKQERVLLEEAKTYHEETLRQLDSFEKIQENLEDIKQTKELFEATLMSGGKTLELIKELEEGADYTGVELKTGVGEKPEKKKTAVKNLDTGKTDTGAKDEVWLKLEVSGNFFNILKFVRYIENSNKIIGVSTLSLVKNRQVTPVDLAAGQEETEEDKLSKAVILVGNNF